MQHVLVRGGDDALHRDLGRLDGQRPNDIVRLEVGELQNRDPQVFQRLPDKRDLRLELWRHRLPLRLVPLIKPGPERDPADVERHAHVRGLQIFQHPVQHPEKAVRRPGRRPVRRRQIVPKGEVRPVQIRVPINEQETVHQFHLPRIIPAAMRA